jgi:hypothetical protein
VSGPTLWPAGALAGNALYCARDPGDGEAVAAPLSFQRLLWAEPEGGRLALISIPAARAFPCWSTRAAVLVALAEGRLIVQGHDPFAPPPLPEEALSPRDRALRDRRWAAIRTLVTDPTRGILYAERRGALVAAASVAAGVARAKIYRYLRLYWQGGQTPNALLPAYDRCGGRGKAHGAGETKRGRPSTLAQADAARAGINVTPEVRDRLLAGGRRFVERERLPLRKAYLATIRTLFHSGHVWQEGQLVPVLPDADRLPTFEQFRYHYGQERTGVRAVRARAGSRRFNLRHRAALGSSTDRVGGPGALYQVDATIGDLYLLSRLIPGRIIGRPVIYVVVDAFSRMIVGLHVGLEGPSWVGMMLALENAFTDKASFAQQLGRPLDPAEWPCQHLPEALLGDRGELLSTHADQLVRAFNIRVANAAPWRADWKAIVERSFRTLNDEVIRWQPGAVYAARERGDPDYRLDATLTLTECTRMLVALVLRHNHTRQLSDDALPLDYPYPVEGGTTPMDLWAWGLEHRSGQLRTADRERVRANLLPAGEASITQRGIRYQGLHYAPLELLGTAPDAALDPDAATFEHWFLRQLGRATRRVPVGSDPRDVATLYLRLDGGRRIVPCALLRGDRRFAGMSLEEVQDTRAVRAIATQAGRSDHLRSEAAFQAEIAAIEAAARRRRADERGPADATAIRAARAAERAVLRRAEAWEAEQAPAADAVPAPEPSLDARRYIPPPSELDLLAATRRQRRGEAEHP